ncbi:MAG: hypothetical protein U1E05_08495, partial [Patescibacteria group bacterium]|nr:hypothetical protein [Patescibacteria group bacterium]
MTRKWFGGAAGIVAAAALILAVSAADAGVMIGGKPNPAWENNSMLVWLKADAGVSADGGGLVSSWADQSTYGRAALQTNATYQPTLSSSGLNGQSAVLWDGSRRFMLLSSQPTGHQTLFAVYKDTSTHNWATPVGTTYNGKGSYHGHNNASQVFTTSYTDPKTVNGESYRDGVPYNPLMTTRPVNWALDVHVATAPLTQNVTTIGADNSNPTTETRYIQGGIAEVILYDRPLNDYERNSVGYYLSQKYDLQTTYTPSAWQASTDLLGSVTGATTPTNPNGQWSYGSSPELGANYAFAALPSYSTNWNNRSNAFRGWVNPSGTYQLPAIVVNVAETLVKAFGAGDETAIEPGQLFTHPGDPSQTFDYSIIRWTAPGDGFFDVSAEWLKKHTNTSRRYILHNGSELFSDFVGNAGNGDTEYTDVLTLNAGDTLDFVVGPYWTGSSFSYGSTGTAFDASITWIPEPSTLLLLGAGMTMALV